MKVSILQVSMDIQYVTICKMNVIIYCNSDHTFQSNLCDNIMLTFLQSVLSIYFVLA